MAFSHDAHRDTISDFIDSIEQGRDPAIPGEEALATQRVIDDILARGGARCHNHVDRAIAEGLHAIRDENVGAGCQPDRWCGDTRLSGVAGRGNRLVGSDLAGRNDRHASDTTGSPGKNDAGAAAKGEGGDGGSDRALRAADRHTRLHHAAAARSRPPFQPPRAAELQADHVEYNRAYDGRAHGLHRPAGATGNLHVEATDRHAITGNFDFVSTDGTNTITIKRTLQGKVAGQRLRYRKAGRIGERPCRTVAIGGQARRAAEGAWRDDRVAESSTEELISAAFLSVAGASVYFRGGSVIYTEYPRRLHGDLPTHCRMGARVHGTLRALLAARCAAGWVRWGLSETGGPARPATATAMRPATHASAWKARIFGAITLETGSADRVANMRAFSKRALEMLAEALG